VYEADSFHSDKVVCIDEHNPYFQMLHNSWGQRLREVFDGIEDPMWDGGQTATPLMQAALRAQALKKIETPDDKLI
jgi:putative proteasome-type protease